MGYILVLPHFSLFLTHTYCLSGGGYGGPFQVRGVFCLVWFGLVFFFFFYATKKLETMIFWFYIENTK